MSATLEMDVQRVRRIARRTFLLCALTGALASLAIADPPRNQRKRTPASRPAATRPAAPEPLADPATMLGAQQRLARESQKSLQPNDRARRVAYEIALAAGAANGDAVADRIDAVGYQSLPLDSALADKPDWPIPPAQIRERIIRRSSVPLDALPADRLAVISREEARKRFPAVAAWSLPTDVILVAIPDGPHWVQRECCLVVRVRGERPVVVGGNFFESLPEFGDGPPTDRREPAAPASRPAPRTGPQHG